MSLKYGTTILIDHSILHWRHGQLHRTDGPAEVRIYTKLILWYEYGLSHRTNGPCNIYLDGSVFYAIRGNAFTEEEYESKIRSIL